MSRISTISKETIEAEYNTIKELQEKCESCKLFKKKTADDVFIYKFDRSCSTENEDAMIAVARYGNIYAIHSSKNFTEKQWDILKSFVTDVEPKDELVVFSQEIFRNLVKYSYFKQLKIQLCV